MKEFGKGSKVSSGPGEVLSEVNLGLKIQVHKRKMTPNEAQDHFNRIQRELNLLSLDPNITFERGSTQVEELTLIEKELRRTA